MIGLCHPSIWKNRGSCWEDGMENSSRSYGSPPDDVTITQTETTVAVEAVRYLLRCSTWPKHLWFGRKFDWGMGQTLKGQRSGWKRTLQTDAKENVTTKYFLLPQTFHIRILHPLPTVISASISAKEMTSSGCFKFGASPNGRLSLHPPSHVRVVMILRFHRDVANLCVESPRRKQ